MASAGRAEPRCSFEIADRIVTLLRTDEEARARWNTLLGRGISASMRDTFLSYRNGRRAEYHHSGAAKRVSLADSGHGKSSQVGVGPHFMAALSRARILS